MFQIGDRVRAIGNQGSYPISGLTGTIVEMSHGGPSMPGVEYDQDFSGGHSLARRLTGESRNRGLWTYVTYLELAKPKEKVKRGFAKAVLKWETQNA